MVKEYLRYFVKWVWITTKGAVWWSGTLLGNILAGLVAILLAGYFIPLIQEKFQGEDMQEWLISVIAIVAFILFLFVLRLIFVVPFQLYQARGFEINTLRSDLEQKKKELHDLVNGDMPDLSFGDAVDLMLKTLPKVDLSRERIEDTLVGMAYRGVISMWGQAPLFGSELAPLSRTPILIPREFFYSPNWGREENGGHRFDIFSALPGWKDQQNHQRYLYVMVKQDQIVAAFSNIIS